MSLKTISPAQTALVQQLLATSPIDEAVKLALEAWKAGAKPAPAAEAPLGTKAAEQTATAHREAELKRTDDKAHKAEPRKAH